jgi:hypothetical protein
MPSLWPAGADPRRCQLHLPNVLPSQLSTRQSTRIEPSPEWCNCAAGLGDGSLLEPFPRRSKAMKRKTWWRLFAKGRRDEQRGLVGMAVAVAGLTTRLANGRLTLSWNTTTTSAITRASTV